MVHGVLCRTLCTVNPNNTGVHGLIYNVLYVIILVFILWAVLFGKFHADLVLLLLRKIHFLFTTYIHLAFISFFFSVESHAVLFHSTNNFLRYLSNRAGVSTGGPQSLSCGGFRHTLHVHTPYQHTRLSLCWLNCFTLCSVFFSSLLQSQTAVQSKTQAVFFTESFCCAFLHLQTLTHSVIRHCSQTT